MHTFRYALRALARSPALTAVAVLSLALGFGANSAILSVFRQVLLRPLPVPHAERLVNLGAPKDQATYGSVSCGNAGDCEAVFSYPMFRDLAAVPSARTRAAGVAAYASIDATLAARGRPVPAHAALVSGSYFPVLGLTPARGRLLGPADEGPAAPRVAVLSHAYWETQLDADPAAVGATVVVNGHPLTVVGVAPRGFAGTTLDERASVFVPITLQPLLTGGSEKNFMSRRNYWAYLFARLAPGATADDARGGLNAVYRPVLRDVELPLQGGLRPTTRARFLARALTVEPGAQGQTRLHADARAPLTLLLATAAVVLLIACANVANLLLARGAGRAAEMALRVSLGATRARLVRLLLAESAALAVAGGAAGLVVARLTLAGLAREVPAGGLASALPTSPDAWTVAATAALALGTGLVFGLFPALHATRPDLASSMRAGAGQIPGGARAAARVRSALVAAQITLSTALLVSAGLFARSLANVTGEPLGVNAERVVTFGLAPERNGYTGARSAALFARVEEALAALPGVTGVTSARVGLLRGDEARLNVSVEGFRPVPGASTDVNANWVGPGFFRTLGTTLLAGREFTGADRAGAPNVVVVNEAFARKFGLGRAAVGKRMAIGQGDDVQLDREIVGVARDAKYSHLKGPVPPLFFVPARQDTTVGAMVFYARTRLDPEALRRGVPPVVHALDANLPVEDLKSLPAQAREDAFTDRLLGTLAGAFAALATALAAVGLYGVLAYTVAQRTRELGVRMALGATAAAVRRLVLGQVGRLVLAGAAAGLLAALALGRLARSLLYGLSGTDPLAVAGALAVLGVASAAAAYLPAARAARISPTRALRYE